MSKGRTHFEKTVILTIGQMAGVGVGFVIPLFLSRWLTLESYGTYKQLMLIHTFLLLTVHFGMDWGLFYFIKRQPDRAPLFSLNAMLVDFLLAVAISLTGLLAAGPLSTALSNPSLAEYLPAFALFVVASIPSHHFNHYLVVLEKVPAAAVLTICYEIFKTLIILGAYFFFHSLKLVLLGLAALSLARTLTLLAFNAHKKRHLGLRFRDGFSHLSAQIRYGVPLGINNLITVVLKLDRFIVSSLFGLREFTIYSVGCFELPVVESTAITLADLMSFDMVVAHQKGDAAEVHSLWRNTLRKIALFHLPLTIFALFFADEIIRLIYSDRYAASVPYFRVFSVVFFLSNFVPEVVFRVFAKTRIPLRIQSVATLYTLALILISALAWGPMGALCGKLAADLITCVLRLSASRRLLQLGWRQLLPWREITLILGNCLASAAFIYGLMPAAHSHLALFLIASFSTYGVLVLSLGVLTHVIRPEEMQALRARLQQGLRVRAAG